MFRSLELVVFSIVALLPTVIANADLLTDGGFESTGLGSGSSFSSYPTFDGSWSAVTTDGELFVDGNAFEGDAYADLLQNSGANGRVFWDELSASFGGYDRIVTFANVAPNTQYTLSFHHNSALDRFGYLNESTLVQVQSLDTADEFDQLFATPANTWVQESITFTTDGSTSQLAILFSPLGNSNASVSVDGVVLTRSIPEPAGAAVCGLMAAFSCIRRRRR